MSFLDKIKKAFNSSRGGSVPAPDYPVVLGIDVSHHQKALDWKKLKSQGVEFCFVKATQGVGIIDPLYYAHTANAQAAGMMTGSYHYFDSKKNPILQAEQFVNHSKHSDLGYVCDWEDYDGLNREFVIDAVLEHLRKLEELTGQKPILYGGVSKLNYLKLDPVFAEYPLWAAHYYVSEPRKVNPWPKHTIHQFTDKLFGQNLDGNRFVGTLEELKQFGKRGRA